MTAENQQPSSPAQFELFRQPSGYMDDAPSSRPVLRFDLIDIGSAELPDRLRELLNPPRATRDGFLIVEGFAARTGVQEYRDANGEARKEYRPPEEVFSDLSMESFIGVPFTDRHPTQLLDGKSARWHAVGAVLDAKPIKSEGLVKVKIIVYDAEMQEEIRKGRKQLSAGYNAELIPETGRTGDGKFFDAIQRNIICNHVAAVAMARGGPQLQLRLDSNGEGVAPYAQAEDQSTEIEKMDEHTDTGGSAYPKEAHAKAEPLDKDLMSRLRKERDDAVSQKDEMSAKLAQMMKEKAEEEEEEEKEDAATVLDGADLTGVTLRGVRERVILKRWDGIELTDKTDNEVKTIYGLALSDLRKAQEEKIDEAESPIQTFARGDSDVQTSNTMKLDGFNATMRDSYAQRWDERRRTRQGRK